MMRNSAVVLMMLAVALSGCFAGQSGDDVPEDGSDPGLMSGCVADPIAWAPDDAENGTHDHKALDHHTPACNMTLLAHHPMVDQYGEFAGAHAVATHEKLVAVSVRNANQGHGFDLFDVTDAANPVMVGQYRDEAATGGDRNLDFSADGRYVFMANEGSNADNAGVRLVDVSNPTNPVSVAFREIQPSGVHTVTAFTIGSTQYVAALNFGVHILELRTVGTTAQLVPIGRFATATPQQIAAHPDVSQTTITRSVYGHDTDVWYDPIADATYMFFAYAYEGMRILDISTPSAPTVVASWAPSDEDSPHYIHQATPYYTEDGKRWVIVEAETFENRHIDSASPMWVVDFTDLNNPQLVTRWVNPGEHGSNQLQLSAHFFDIYQDKVFMSHYHAGVWVLDLKSDPPLAVLGYYQPNQDTGFDPPETCCLGWNLDAIPMAFDLDVDADGNVLVADYATGFYVLRYDGE